MTTDPRLRRATAAVLASLAALPLPIVAAGMAPDRARVPAFVVGTSVVAALALAGGISARRALLEDTPAKVRAVAVSWIGLMLGVTAGIFCLWALAGWLIR